MAPKKKVGKKERDKKKKEEEERRRQEEEEARIKAEQEEKERVIRERIEAEELKKLEKQELKKRSIELEEFRALLAVHEDKLIEDERNRQLTYVWERYLLCDGSPDPTIPHEINTYINLWREDNKHVTMEPVMKEGTLCLRLISELESLIDDYKLQEEFANDIERYYKTIRELQILLQEKINRACLEMLSRAKMLIENETCNLEKMWNYDKMILCLWGNIAKSNKVTKFVFLDIGTTVYITRSLTSTDVAFRILYTKYDHYSSLCKYFNARQKIIKKVDIVEVFPEVIETIGVVDDHEGSIKSDDLNLMDELNDIDENEKEESLQEQEEEIDPPPEDCVPSPYKIEWEDFDGEIDVIDLRNFAPIGGLFQIEMVNMPPQPKIINGWTMTEQVVPPEMTPFQYDVENKILFKNYSSYDVTDKETQISAQKDRVPQSGPVRISINFPKTVILADHPTLGMWDKTNNLWRTGFLSVLDKREDENIITFEIYKYGIIGVFQDFHINMPFHSWTIRPYHVLSKPTSKIENIEESNTYVKPILKEDVFNKDEMDNEQDHNSGSRNQALIIINAAIYNVTLHVCDNRVRIMKDSEDVGLNSLAGIWYTVREIIEVMRFAGINIFPREDSNKYVFVTEKNAIAENRLYDQVALLSPSVAFSSSRWNSQNKSVDSIIVLASEHLNVERTVNEDDWSVLSFTRKKVAKLKMKEYDEKFSTETDDRIEFHSNLFHFYQDFGCEEGMIAVKNIDCHYYDTMRNLLKAIRPVCFT